MTTDELARLAEIYSLVKARARAHEEGFGEQFAGFVILHAPLLLTPDLLVLGAQPNGSPKDRRESEEVPPNDDQNSLRRGRYQLALMTTAIFERAGQLDRLNQAQFFDTNFFRPLHDDDEESRGLFDAENELFCGPFVLDLIRLVRPKRIVTLGRSPLLRVAPRGPWDRWGMLRVMREAHDLSFEGTPITPLVHLSGQGSKLAHFSAAIDRLSADLEG